MGVRAANTDELREVEDAKKFFKRVPEDRSFENANDLLLETLSLALSERDYQPFSKLFLQVDVDRGGHEKGSWATNER